MAGPTHTCPLLAPVTWSVLREAQHRSWPSSSGPYLGPNVTSFLVQVQWTHTRCYGILTINKHVHLFFYTEIWRKKSNTSLMSATTHSNLFEKKKHTLIAEQSHSEMTAREGACACSKVDGPELPALSISLYVTHHPPQSRRGIFSCFEQWHFQLVRICKRRNSQQNMQAKKLLIVQWNKKKGRVRNAS